MYDAAVYIMFVWIPLGIFISEAISSLRMRFKHDTRTVRKDNLDN